MLKARTTNRAYLAAEFVALFLVLPTVLYIVRTSMIGKIIPVIVLTGAAMTVLLLLDPDFDRARLRGFGKLKKELRGILIRLAVLGSMLTVPVLVLQPENFLAFPKEAPRTWLYVMLFYPLVSAYPQELIFRSFVFHRYQLIFGDGQMMIIASAVGFGMAHLFFGNWIAPVLSALGGYLFAVTYSRSRTILASSVEHGLWGDFIFTVGLGIYFYGGAIN